MSDAANVRSIQAIAELKAGLTRFGGETRDALQTAEIDIQRTIGWLQERLRHWQREVQRWQVEVQRAAAALQRCQQSGRYDERTGRYERPNCSAQKNALRQAHAQLQKAQTELQTVQHWMQVVEQAVATYRQQSRALQQQLSAELPKAAAFLERAIMDLERYVAVSQVSSIQPSAASRAVDMNVPQAQGTSEWVDMGIHYVRVADLPDPDGINNASDFKKVSISEMEAGLGRLQRMQSAIDSGEGASSDYWRQVDEQEGLDYQHGYQRIYEAFYGDDAIYLEKDGNQFDIINGRHRIWLARQMGIDTLPARVKSRRGGTL